VSVRETGDPPDIRRFAAEELERESARHAVLLARNFATTAIVTPADRIDAMRAAAVDAGGDAAESDAGNLEHRITVLPAALAKGLEFDAVLVLEPAAIVAESAHGIRLLFVALTRAVQHLAIAHAEPLPAVLR
jgi:superfamily I DNA/RNA helicase